MIKGLLAFLFIMFLCIPLAGNILIRNTFEAYEGSTPEECDWTKAIEEDGIVLLDEESDSAYQTQAHGVFSLRIYDPNDSSYANACKTFTNSASEYMIEFYFWMKSDRDAPIDSFPLCVLWNAPPEESNMKTDIALVLDTLTNPPNGYQFVVRVKDNSGFHTGPYLDTTDLDEWHKIQIHRRPSMIIPKVDLFFNGDLVDSFIPMNFNSTTNRISFGTTVSDSLADGEIFYDDVIITSPPTGEHPRLLFIASDTTELRNRKDDDESSISFSYKDIWEIFEEKTSSFEAADTISYFFDSLKLAFPFPQPPGHPAYTEQERWLPLSTQLERFLTFLSFYSIIEDDSSCLDRSRQILLSLCNDWRQWTDPDFRQKRAYYSLLDTGRLLSGISLAYDMLFDSLTTYERMTVQNSIISLGIAQTFCRALYDTSYTTSKSPWDWPNGNAVMLGPMGLGCNVLDGMDNDSFISVYLDTARSKLDTLTESSWVLDPAGGWSEGMSYSAFGMPYLLAFMQADSIFEDSILADTSFIYHHAAWRAFCMLPVDSNFSQDSMHHAEIPFSDYDRSGWKWTTAIYRLADLFSDSTAQWYINQRPAHYPAQGSLNNYIQYIFPFLWLNDTLDTLQPDSSHYLCEDIEWGILRTGWDIDDCVFALKGDSIKAHTHYNRNGFIFGMGGRWFIEDWGYARKVGTSRYGREAEYHNVIIADNENTKQNSTGRITKFYGSDDYGYLMGDASDCYDELDTWTREVVFLKEGGYFLVKDWIWCNPTGGPSPDTLCWQVHTYIVQSDSDSLSINYPTATMATISKDGKHLRMELHEPGTATIDTTTPYFRTAFKRIYDEIIDTTGIDSVLYITSYVAFDDGDSCPDVSEISADSMYAFFIDTEEDDNAILFSKRGNTVTYTQYEIDVPASYVVLNVLADMAGGTYKIEDEYPLGMSNATSYKAATSEGTLDFEISGSGTHKITVTKWL